MKAQNDKTMLVAAFDLKKSASLRLKLHNFTITNIATMDTSCFLWHEGEADKGSCESAFALQQYLPSFKKQGKNVCHLFVDRCGGQNNNRMVVIALHEAFLKHGFDEITFNFLVIGHSQNENDNAHSVIEAAVWKHTLYTMAQWETAIQFAFKKSG